MYRTLVLWHLLGVLSVAAPAYADTWECTERAGRNRSSLTALLTAATESMPATVQLDDTLHEASYDVVGDDRVWRFPWTGSGDPEEVFVIGRDGEGRYESSALSPGEVRGSFRCRAREASATTTDRTGTGPRHRPTTEYESLSAVEVNRRIELWKSTRGLGSTFIDTIPSGVNAIEENTWRNCVALQRIGNPPYGTEERKLLLYCLSRYSRMP